MDSTKKTARIAGLLYILASSTAPLGLLYVPSKVFVPGDATATAAQLTARASMVRIAIASELLGQILFIFVVVVLYRLFKPVNKQQALVLLILGALIPVPIVFVNALNEVAAMILVSGANFLSVFEKRQLDALALLFLNLHDQGITIAAIFWGLWLFPFGILVIQSRFIPRVLGLLLMLAGSAYVVSSFTAVALPQYADAVDRYARIVRTAEMPIIFWLAIWGAKTQRPAAAA
jgi:hypothetical protein